MSTKTKAKKPLTFFTLPWPIFLVVTIVCLLATYLGVLPKGMAGCFLFMMVLGEILAWIGDHTPIIKDYLDEGIWQKARKEAFEAIDNESTLKIEAYDIDAKAIKAAKLNLEEPVFLIL